MTRYIPAEIEAYAERFTTPPDEVLEELAAETRATQANHGMMVGVVEGAFLSFLVFMIRPRLVLEVGTFTGWSTLAMARNLPAGATLITCDINEETTAIAKKYAEKAGVADRIDFRIGPARETLEDLEGPFDLAFIDADKGGYVDYYETILPKLTSGGTIVADNTLFGTDGETIIAQQMTRFNEHVFADKRVDAVLLSIREGVTLIRKR